MVACKNCLTPNSLDSTFCKRCGTALSETEVIEAKEKLEALIAEGTTAFNEGRTSEAMAVAESACATNPSSISALSLKALCHERRGELAEALECADLIVDLNPDSELDKIKRNQLRSKLSMSVQLATLPPDRKPALIGGVAVVVLVLCLGFGAAKMMNRADANKPSNPVVFSDQHAQTSQQPVIPAVVPNTASQNSGTANQAATQPNRSVETPPAESRAPRYPDGGGLLPGQGFDDSGMLALDGGGNTPVRPQISGQIGGNSPSSVKVPTPIAGTKETNSGGDTVMDTQNGQASAQTNNDPGQIQIEISNGSHRAQLGGSVSVGAGGVAALNKIGIQKYQLGQFSAAASSFEQAINAGGDQIKLNQWLGRCYESLGKKSDEIDAYKKCVSACQSALTSGSGNKAQVQTILDTCQQELKVLQGN